MFTFRGVSIPSSTQFIKHPGIILDKKSTRGSQQKSNRKSLNTRLRPLRPKLKSKLPLYNKTLVLQVSVKTDLTIRSPSNIAMPNQPE